jgi:hypothetical protein
MCETSHTRDVALAHQNMFINKTILTSVRGDRYTEDTVEVRRAYLTSTLVVKTLVERKLCMLRALANAVRRAHLLPHLSVCSLR